MKKIFAGLVGGILALGVAGPVAAASPDRAPVLNETVVDELSCPFPVQLSYPAQNETATTFYDANGNVTKVIISGRLVLTFTNLNNGTSLTVNASGPAVLNYKSGRLFALGAGGGPLPGLGLVSGHGQLNLLTFEFKGHLVPLCGALAG
jgi:hypothetical protein